MAILLDVGAHFGQTTEIALDPKWNFCEIHAFEPSCSAFMKLDELKADKLQLHNFGLFSEDKDIPLYNSGQVGASIYRRNLKDNPDVEIIHLVSASNWIISNLDLNKEIFLKLNCEGSEVDILQNLIDSNLIEMFAAIYIDFDIRKFPGQEYRRELLETQLDNLKINYVSWEEIQLALSESEKQIPFFSFSKWLEINLPQVKPNIIDSLRYHMLLHLKLNRRVKCYMKIFLPSFILRIVRVYLRYRKAK